VSFFVLGLFIGGLMGALGIVLAIAAGKNAANAPETPMGVGSDQIYG
jgi:hypothetical protein